MKKLMIVDDEKQITSLLMAIAGEIGYESECYTNPLEAVDRYEKGKFGLVITDYQMPGTNGADFAQRIRMEDPEIHIVMMTSHKPTADRLVERKIINEGLGKPFKISEMSELMKKHMGDNQ